MSESIEKWSRHFFRDLFDSADDIIVVEDVDSALISNEDWLAYLNSKGWQLIAYESEFRLRQEIYKARNKKIVCVHDAKLLPFSFSNQYQIIHVDIKGTFNYLNYDLLRKLPAHFLPVAFDYYDKVSSHFKKILDSNQTLILILKWLWNIDFSAIKTVEDLFADIIKFHIQGHKIPNRLLPYIDELLKTKNFKYPSSLLFSKHDFYELLQNEWTNYLTARLNNQEPVIHFQFESLRMVIDNLFDSKDLNRVDADELGISEEQIQKICDKEPWAVCGIKIEESEKVKIEMGRAFAQELHILNNLKRDNIQSWLEVAKHLGKLGYFFNHSDLAVYEEEFKSITSEINQLFIDFINRQYREIFYYPVSERPYTVNKILPYLLNQNEKFALLCFDGMGFEEWEVIKYEIQRKLKINFNELAIFSILPTLTEYSRKAIYQGRVPKDFLKSKDEIVFKREIQKLHPDVRILFKNIYPVFLSVKEEKKLNFNDYDFVSLLFLFIDDAAHKSECETFHKKLFHDHLIKMMNSSNVIQIIDQLISSNFKIYICSDHGTIYSKGNGIDADKFLTESHARRALRYSNKHLAQEKAKESNSLFWWDPETLGEDDFFVLAAGDSMFDKQTSFAITHGGISVQEVIVPFVEIIS